ncbi:hypothetical protein [Nostoc sp.]|uniref:hypothetical protein n=1 Tax=Nostoc sp. TaxID=1180 RepID=UPI002FF8A04E
MPGVQFRTYSAAQLILPSGEFAPILQEKRQLESKRRHIEIRFTRLGEVREVNKINNPFTTAKILISNRSLPIRKN